MRKIILLSFLLCTVCIKGQNNDLNPSSMWHCWDLDGTTQCKDVYNQVYRFNGDTVITGNHYYKLFSWGRNYNILFSPSCPYYNIPFNHYHGLVRYHQNKLYLSDGVTEQVFIDYNLLVGDTIKNVLFTTDPLKVTRIDSVPISNYYSKRFHYSSIFTADTGYVIEKIGSVHGFISPFTPFFENSRELICYWESNDLQYVEPGNHQVLCDITTDINTFRSRPFQINVYPNPATNDLTIEAQNNTMIKKISIKNCMGQILLEDKTVRAKRNYNLSGYPPGVYFIETETEEGVFSNKFLKH